MTTRGLPLLSAAALAAAAAVAVPPAARADEDPVGFRSFSSATQAGGGTVRVGLERDSGGGSHFVGAARAPAFVQTFEYVRRCGREGAVFFGGTVTCSRVGCTAADGREGVAFMVLRREVEVATGREVGGVEILDDVCRPRGPAETAQLEALVLKRFRSMKLPAVRVRADPAGLTLVHWPTTLSAEPGWSRRSMGRILGHRVRLEISPVRYAWKFGDGDSLTTRGRKGSVRHAYARPGPVGVSVAATYRARYRVDGGDPRRIPGTVTVAGPATPLDVRSARTQLIAGPATMG